MARAAVTPDRTARVYHCAVCGRELKDGRWVYSAHTGNRFCLGKHLKQRKAAT